MIDPTKTGWRARLFLTGVAAAFALITLAIVSPPAHARVWVSVGVPCCGYWGPGPYWGYPPPYAYVPPPGYYPPPPGYGAPGPGAYPPAASAPSAYTPGSPTHGAATTPASPAITYTDKPAFTNSAGQTCREYKTTDTAGGHNVYGTACRQADGQWRVVN